MLQSWKRMPKANWRSVRHLFSKVNTVTCDSLGTIHHCLLSGVVPSALLRRAKGLLKDSGKGKGSGGGG